MASPRGLSLDPQYASNIGCISGGSDTQDPVRVESSAEDLIKLAAENIASKQCHLEVENGQAVTDAKELEKFKKDYENLIVKCHALVRKSKSLERKLLQVSGGTQTTAMVVNDMSDSRTALIDPSNAALKDDDDGVVEHEPTQAKNASSMIPAELEGLGQQRRGPTLSPDFVRKLKQFPHSSLIMS